VAYICTKSQLKLYYLAYKTPFSWKQTVSTAVYLSRMMMSSHVRTMFGHGISSPNPQRFWNSAKHPNWMSHLFWNREAAEQPPRFRNRNGHFFQFRNRQILKNGQFGGRRFQNRSYRTGPKHLFDRTSTRTTVSSTDILRGTHLSSACDVLGPSLLTNARNVGPHSPSGATSGSICIYLSTDTRVGNVWDPQYAST
jgi:hypothetical protein